MAMFEEDHLYPNPLFAQYVLQWHRYIDIFCIWNFPLNKLLEFLSVLNNVHPELHFTLHYHITDMNFLDNLVIKDRVVLEIDVGP